MNGLIGRKLGMTRVFDGEGRQVLATVVECGPCVVLQLKQVAVHGYDAVQVGFGDVSEKRLSKPDLGIFRKLGVPPKRYRCEFDLDQGDSFKAGDVVTAKMFEGVGFVDVSGVNKGKGFQGVMRRHKMSGGVMTHGGHSKRRIGSIGCRELPGRVHKGKRMPGHMGHVWVTNQNLKIVQVRPDDNVILLCGSVPGPRGSIVTINKSLKKRGAIKK